MTRDWERDGKKCLCRLQTGFPLTLRFSWEDLSYFRLFLESDFRNRPGLGLGGRPRLWQEGNVR